MGVLGRRLSENLKLIALRRAFTPKWRCSPGVPLGLEILITIECESLPIVGGMAYSLELEIGGLPPLLEWSHLSEFYTNGGGYSKVGEPLTVEEEYEAIWKRAGLDANELARLRSEGWTVSQLVAYFGYSRTSIKRLLKLQRLSDLP